MVADQLYKKKIVSLIVQARIGSKRLPEKTILPLAGKPLIYRIMERLKYVEYVDNLILAIPNTEKDKKILKIKFDKKVKIFRGSENNLISRYYSAAKKFNTDVVVRFPGDNCIPDPVEISRLIKFYLSKNKDFFASNIMNVFKNGYPDGIGAEIFSFKFLEKLMKKKVSKKKREHIHLNFLNYEKNKAVNSKWCQVKTIKCPIKIRRPEISLDVNTKSQYLFIKNIYKKLYYKKKFFSTKDVIKLIDQQKKV